MTSLRVAALHMAAAALLSCPLSAAQVLAVRPNPMPDPASVPRMARRAAQNDVGAQVLLAVTLENAGDFAGAAHWYTKAAHRGHSFAQNNLGVLYVLGRGVAADDATALLWFRRAAVDSSATMATDGARARAVAVPNGNPGTSPNEPPDSRAGVTGNPRPVLKNGNVNAQYNLAVMYVAGRGVPADAAAARHWLEGAASRGFAPAQFRLGYMIQRGEGGPADTRESERWYQRAAAQGWTGAEVDLAVLYLQGSGMKRDYGTAAKLLRHAAEQNCGEAEYDLGLVYALGLGVARDASAADYWIKRARSHGLAREAEAFSTVAPEPPKVTAPASGNAP